MLDNKLEVSRALRDLSSSVTLLKHLICSQRADTELVDPTGEE